MNGAAAVVEILQANGEKRIFNAALGEIALVVIDVQKEFCDPEAWSMRGNATTTEIAGRIAAFMPEMAAACIPSRIVYSAPQPLPASRVDLYRIAAENPEDLLCKFNNCAFTGTQLHEKLKHQGVKLVLFAGFNTSACIKETLANLPPDYTPCLLEDLTGNDEDANRFERSLPALQALHEQGVPIARGRDILASLRQGLPVVIEHSMPEISQHHVTDATRPLRPPNPMTWLCR